MSSLAPPAAFAPAAEPASRTSDQTSAAASASRPARAHAPDAVREVNMALLAVLQAAPAAILSVDGRGAVLSWNPAAEAMFGWSAPEVMGRPNPLLDAGATGRGAFSDALARILAGRAPGGVELACRRKDGALICVRLYAAPLRGAEDQPLGAVAILTDMTAQKQLQTELVHAQKMEAVGRLAGGIAHDFNNLLTVVLCSAEMAAEQLDEDHAAATYLRSIEQAARRASELTGQLLAFARRHIAVARTVDLNDIARETTEMLRRVLGAHVALRVELAPAPCLVHADAGLLQQVVMNLGVNARDAMAEGGALTIRTARRTLRRPPAGASHLPPGRYIALTVADTGQGMTEEVLAHVFEPFYTTKDIGKGTGLGLPTSLGIVEQCGGAILAESRPHCGATFTVLLPAVPTSAARPLHAR